MPEAKITASKVQIYTVPTDSPEADGTYDWTSTTMVLVRIYANGKCGLGFTYADAATGALAKTLLHKVVEGCNVFSHTQIWLSMLRYVRNLGETGISQMAVAAIDNALWDLRARLLEMPLVQLIGLVRPSIAVYGSGGFTSYSDSQLSAQLGGWASEGFSMVKMKVGTHPGDDVRRVQVARKAIGAGVTLFTDANGAYTVTQALRLAYAFSEEGVRWFEEPVSSDNLSGLRQIRERAPNRHGCGGWRIRL